MPRRYVADELLGREPLKLGREGGDERRLDPRLREQLEPPLERRQQLDPVPEHDAGMRVERDHGRLEPRSHRRVAARTRDRGARRRRCRSRPRAAAARAATARARSSSGLHEPRSASSSGMTRVLVGLLDAERPDLGAPQRDAVAAERLGDRADVGARADEEVEARRCRPRTRRAARARGRASTRAASRRRRPGGGAGRRARRRSSPPTRPGSASSTSPRSASSARSSSSRAGRIVLVDRLALGVARRRAAAEVDLRHVALVEPTNRSWRLVARPERRRRRPVANGSSVPAWPVFAPVRAPDARRRSRTTTAPPACRRG